MADVVKSVGSEGVASVGRGPQVSELAQRFTGDFFHVYYELRLNGIQDSYSVTRTSVGFPSLVLDGINQNYKVTI